MDKKLKALKKVFENEIPVSFTDRDKHGILANIKQKGEKSSRGINHFLPITFTAIMITTLFFIFNYQFNFIELGFSNGNKDYDEVRSEILLENVISEDGQEYIFEQIPWFSTKQELIDRGHIPAVDNHVTSHPNKEGITVDNNIMYFGDHVTIQPDGESIMLNDNITFKDPQSEAKVIYKFQHDLFIGGEYIVITKNEDDLVRIATDLKSKVNEYFPDPIEGTLEGLSEDTIREIHHGNSRGASWWQGDNNIEYSSFEIRITKTTDGEGVIRLSVRPPELSEELEEELIEKDLLPSKQEEFTEDDIHIEAILKHNQSERMAYKDYILEVVIHKNNDNKNMIYPYIEGLHSLAFDENEEEGYFTANNIGTSDNDEQAAIDKLKEQQIIDQHTNYPFLGFSVPEEPGNYKMRLYFDAEEDFILPNNPIFIYIDTENDLFGKQTRTVKLVQIDSEIVDEDLSGQKDVLTETYETTIELSDELLEVYNQYKVSLDDLLLNDLKPIDIFKLYHHAVQMDHQEIVYVLFIQDGTYEIPDKETYLNDIASADDKIMKENDRKYYEKLMAVKEFNEVYKTENEAVITYSTDSSENEQIFQLLKDQHTNVWKVSWLPIQ